MYATEAEIKLKNKNKEELTQQSRSENEKIRKEKTCNEDVSGNIFTHRRMHE